MNQQTKYVKEGFGITTAVGIGGDPIIGLSYKQLLPMFEADPETKAIVMIGEIGGDLGNPSSSLYQRTYH